MQDISEYIEKVYNNSLTWFEDECKQPWHMTRISKVLQYKDYLQRIHKVLARKDYKYKGKTFVVRKNIFQTLKTILNFHSTYICGKPVSLAGDDVMVKEFNNVYRQALYSNVDYNIADKINKYGDSYEVIYLDENKNIKSKIVDSADGYPVYSETGDYVAFIEYWTINAISYYDVYYIDRTEHWSNEGGELQLIDSGLNISGVLPVHYHNKNDWDTNFGQSMLEDLIPIMDEIEDFLSKFGDGIYTNVINPILAVSGIELDDDDNVDVNANGIALNLGQGGTASYITANMDYNTAKLYLDNLKQQLIEVAQVPSIIMNTGNVANVSEVSLQLLFQLADNKALENEVFLRDGMNKRFKAIQNILDKKGITFNEDAYVEPVFNYNRPIATTELINNLATQYDKGCLDKRTFIERSPLTTNVDQVLERLKKEEQEKESNTNGTNNTDDIENNMEDIQKGKME